MRVLITGGAGYIGTHTSKTLALAGYEPVVFDNLSTGHRQNVRWGPFVHGDVSDVALLRTTIRTYHIEACIHFAGSAYVGESMKIPAAYFRNNVGKTLGLLDVLVHEGGIPIIFSSTCATYGVPRRVPITEDEPQHPVSPYGESKLFVERMLHWVGVAHGLPWIALRYFNAAGADPDGEIGEVHTPETHLIPLAIAVAYGDMPALDVFGTDYATPDGTAVRDYTHVTDLAGAHLCALKTLANGAPSGPFNIGTGQGHSVQEVISAVEQVSGRKVDVREAPRRSGDPAVLVADTSRAAEQLNWTARYSSLRNIIETACRWYESYNRQREAPLLQSGKAVAVGQI